MWFLWERAAPAIELSVESIAGTAHSHKMFATIGFLS